MLYGRCDIISEWFAEGGDLAIWLAKNGYPSPLAICPRQFTVLAAGAPTFAFATFESPWKLGFNAAQVEFGDQKKIVTIDASWDGNPRKIVVDLPCTFDVMNWNETFVFEIGWFKSKTIDNGKTVTLFATSVWQPLVSSVALPIPNRRIE